jgi:hypothetical protein
VVASSFLIIINNNCQGNCFLEKQINILGETENNASNPTEKKISNWNGTDDCVFEKNIRQAPTTFSQISLPFFIDVNIDKIETDIPSPPPRRFV